MYELFWVLDVCVGFVSCIVMMSGCVLYLLVPRFSSDAVYVDLYYDDVFVVVLNVVCEWVFCLAMLCW